MKTNRKVYILILSALLIISMMPFYVFADAQNQISNDSGASVEATEADQPDSDDNKSSDAVNVEKDSDTAEDADSDSDNSKEQATEEKDKSSTNDSEQASEKTADDKQDKGSATEVVPFTGKAGGVEVNVEAPKNAFPEGTTMKVVKVDDKKVIEAINDAVEGEAKTVKAVDITFLDAEGKEIQPKEPIKVTLKSSAVAEAESPVVVHVDKDDDGNLVGEKVEKIAADPEKKEVSFEAEKFSVYAVVDESTDDEGRATLNFYGKDTTTPIATVYVKNSDTAAELEQIIYDPGAGILADSDLFRGWNISTVDTTDGKNYTVATDGKSIEDVRNYFETLTITEGQVYNIYAMIFKAYNVQYKDEDGVAIHTETLINKTGEAIDYTVIFPYTPKDQDAQFQGWSVSTGSDKINPAPGEMTDLRYPNGTDVSISGNITFQADPAEGFWLIFNENGNGASYTPPQFIGEGSHPVNPSSPTRLGYTFDGWYTGAPATPGGDPTGTKVEDVSSLTLTQRTTLYAKWKVNDAANYTVIIWKQNLNGDGYDFGETIQLSGTPNTTINTVSQQGTGDNAYARVNGVNKQYEGFHLKEFDQNVNIEPDGSSVVNVYYDRTEYTLRFFYARTYTYNNRTYVQVNCNNEGFLQGRRNRRNLNQSLTYRSNSGDYRRVAGTNTWKDVNNNSINGNPLSLVSADYLAKENVSTGTLNINNVSTDVFTISNNGRQRNTRTVNTTYYYIDVKVRYEQSLDDLWPVPNEAFISQTMTNYNDATDTGNYTTISPLLQGSWATGNNLGGKYSKMDMDVFVNNDTTAYFLTYWRFEAHHEYQYNVYFSALDNETPTTTYNGKGYVLQNDKSYVVANGQGWGSGADTDSGNGYWDVGTVTFDGTNKVGRVDINNGTINVYYDRIEQTINYNDGTYVNGDGVELQNKKDQPIERVENVPFGTNLNSYNKGEDDYYIPTAPEGYVFDGWYMDSSGTQPYTFTTMPKEDITVYAKWVKKQYRVFMHPNVDSSDTSLDWGNQSMSFRVDFGDQIAGGNDIIGTRDDYELIGWYTDPERTKAFNFGAFVLNDTTVTTDYDKTEPTELDKYGKPTSTENKDVERFWIERKLELYAKWRAKLQGAKGINVVYSADDPDTVNGSNAPTDMLDYLDNSEAVAGAASTPSDNKYQFLHWVVQTWDKTKEEYVDTERIVYPGDTFTVLKADARVEDISGSTDPDINKKYTVQLRAAYGPKEAPTPTHITWYDNFTNNPAEGRNYITDNNLQINQAVPIEPATRFTRPGYKFLGWARVDTTDGSGNPLNDYSLKPRNLDEDDVYLKYDEATGQFTAKGADGNIHTVSKVAADEKHPYHDMYAVWEPIKYTVVIRKHITGDYSNLAKEFTYTPSETLGGQQATFTLTDYGRSNIQKKFENINYNTVVSVTEAQQDYTKTVTVKKYSDPEMTTQVGATQTITDGSDITVDNYVLIEYKNTLDVIITGVKDHGGMLALVAVGIAAIAGTFLMQRYSRRRRSMNARDADK